MQLKSLSNPQFFQSLNKVMRAEIPVQLAWKLKGLAKFLESQNQAYEEMRNELLKKHGRKDDKGELLMAENGQVEFDEGKRDAFIKEHQELLNQEVEVKDKIKLSDLSSVRLSASDLLVLEDLIQE